jgi:hypothetical protein
MVLHFLNMTPVIGLQMFYFLLIILMLMKNVIRELILI